MKVIMQSSSLSCKAKITMNGSLPGCQAQPSEGGVCQSRDLQSVHETQMSNTLCLKLKLASALHFPNLGLAALFIKLPDTSEWERDFLFSCFVL